MRKLQKSAMTLAMIALVFLTFFGCAMVERGAYKKAYKTNTIENWQEFFEKYPHSQYASNAESNLRRIQELEWEATEKENTYTGYADYLDKKRGGELSGIAKQRIPSAADFSDAQIDNLIQAKNRGEKWALEAVTVERLLFTGANLLDDRAAWIGYDKARLVYNLLKCYELDKLIPAIK